MKKKFVALVLALVALAVIVPTPAQAFTTYGVRIVDFPGHGDAKLKLYIVSNDPALGIAVVVGWVEVIDLPPFNINWVHAHELILRVKRDNGIIENLQTIGGGTNGSPANNRAMPNYIQDPGPNTMRQTLETACLHPRDEPGGIGQAPDGNPPPYGQNDAWVRFDYHINWMDGSTTSGLSSSVSHLFNQPADCQ